MKYHSLKYIVLLILDLALTAYHEAGFDLASLSSDVKLNKLVDDEMGLRGDTAQFLAP
jgi:hypothetical protein